MFPELGFVDTLSTFGINHNSAIVRADSNPYAAMPSLHAADALIVGTWVKGAIVGRQCALKSHVILEEGSVIGDHTIVGDHARVRAQVKVWPDKQIESGVSYKLYGVFYGPARQAARRTPPALLRGWQRWPTGSS